MEDLENNSESDSLSPIRVASPVRPSLKKQPSSMTDVFSMSMKASLAFNLKQDNREELIGTKKLNAFELLNFCAGQSYMNKMFDVVEKSKIKNYYHTHFTTLSSPEEVLTAILRSMKRVGGSSARITPHL